jgi:oligo-1,6-glucosidase
MMKRTFVIFLYSIFTISIGLPAAWSQTAPAPPKPATSKDALINGYRPIWWKEAVVYQIYPRSFKDSNGDGIGDLKGITSKLDYIKGLGIDVIWLSPHFDSPNADNGYDIRDYRKVMTEFGNMSDFDEMLAGIKQRHMRLIIDLVVNHTSDENKWFVESRSSKDNKYRDYYIWKDGKPNPQSPTGFDPPNNYPSFFFGSAWQFDSTTKQYYLHYFAVKQPDLNWDNPKVRKEVFDLMTFWLDKGVDGFRMDVIPLISKRVGLPDLTPTELKNAGDTYANGPHMHEYLQEMNRNVMAKYDVMTVGEALGISLEQTPLIVGESRNELNMIFNFDAVRINRDGKQWKSWTLPDFKAIYARHAAELDQHSWDTVFLSNHDNPRLVSSFGDDSPAYRVPSAKLLVTMILSLRGTPFLYQGDELGMTNFPFKSISEFDDIEAKNGYKADVLTKKVTEEAYIDNLRHMSRDNARTPMQWDGSSQAGFTSGNKPWLAVNPNYPEINAAAELADANSIYHYTQKMIALRHATPALVYGDYKDLDPTNASIFCYSRSLGNERYLIVLNFAKESRSYAVPGGLKPTQLVLSNLATSEVSTSTINLRGWEARVYKY